MNGSLGQGPTKSPISARRSLATAASRRAVPLSRCPSLTSAGPSHEPCGYPPARPAVRRRSTHPTLFVPRSPAIWPVLFGRRSPQPPGAARRCATSRRADRSGRIDPWELRGCSPMRSISSTGCGFAHGLTREQARSPYQGRAWSAPLAINHGYAAAGRWRPGPAPSGRKPPIRGEDPRDAVRACPGRHRTRIGRDFRHPTSWPPGIIDFIGRDIHRVLRG